MNLILKNKKLFELSEENYKTHEFEQFGFWGNKQCNNCGMYLHKGWMNGILLSIDNISCDEYIIKNIIE